jgi:hypothetical protein
MCSTSDLERLPSVKSVKRILIRLSKSNGFERASSSNYKENSDDQESRKIRSWSSSRSIELLLFCKVPSPGLAASPDLIAKGKEAEHDDRWTLAPLILTGADSALVILEQIPAKFKNSMMVIAKR